MQTKDHKLLSEYIIGQTGGFAKKIYEKAFIIGSVEPDLNVFSYLKGSIKHRMFMGHNYHNSIRYVKNASDRLKRKEHSKWNVMDYFRLGKLIHYIADDFTLAHNEGFSGNLYEHNQYEDQLHSLFAEYLKCKEMFVIRYEPKVKLGELLERLHDKYITSHGGHLCDAKWIVEMTWISVCYYLKPRKLKKA